MSGRIRTLFIYLQSLCVYRRIDDEEDVREGGREAGVEMIDSTLFDSSNGSSLIHTLFLLFSHFLSLL